MRKPSRKPRSSTSSRSVPAKSRKHARPSAEHVLSADVASRLDDLEDRIDAVEFQLLELAGLERRLEGIEGAVRQLQGAVFRRRK